MGFDIASFFLLESDEVAAKGFEGFDGTSFFLESDLVGAKRLGLLDVDGFGWDSIFLTSGTGIG